jgi:WS/DGAT/MGAT family acyltransferase
MQPLTGNDLFQLYMESPSQPMHTLKVLVLDPAAAIERDTASPATAEGLFDWATRAVAAIPPLHWRLVAAPLRLGAAAWVEQDRLDVSAHIRTTRVAAPGGREEFGAVLAALMQERLERDRPLWELWLVEGLAGGRVAHVWKMHHAIADGGASARILDRLYQHAVEERAQPANREQHPPATTPPATTPPALTRIALRRHGRLIAALPGLVRRSRSAKRVSARRRRLGLPAGAKAMSGPMTRYNRGLTPHRTVAWARLEMSDIAVVRRAFDCTVNDVFLSTAAGALRSHLEAAGELPDKPLTASVPVGLRSPDQADDYANRIGVWYLSLATHIADPVERLTTTRVVTRGAREAAEQGGGPRLLDEWQAYTVLFKPVNGLGALGARHARRPLFNLTLSNVRGPADRLYADGVPVVELFSLSVLATGQGLNATGWSYDGAFVVGLVACPEHEPALWALADALPRALDELKQAALGRPEKMRDVAGTG